MDGNINNFEFLVDALMQVYGYEEREGTIQATKICRILGGADIYIPKKQGERASARVLLQNGVSFNKVKEVIYLHEFTIKKIQNEVYNEQK